MTDFAMAFSLGKDSALALFRMLNFGFNPVSLVTMFSRSAQRSWFHGADEKMLNEMARCLGVKALIMTASGDEYAQAFEKGLISSKELGASHCAFGDIDLDSNRRWEEDRCTSTGLVPVFPLWGENRSMLVRELLGNKFKCLIKTINTQQLPLAEQEKRIFCEKYLGQPLDWEFVHAMEDMGLDACGENGEYHTIVVDAPFLKKPLPVRTGKILWFDNHAAMDISAL